MTKIKLEEVRRLPEGATRLRVQVTAYNKKSQSYQSTGIKAAIFIVPKGLNLNEVVRAINRAVTEAVS
jgi:hypothetical protein